MIKNEAIELLKRYRDGKCNEQEIILVESWYAGWHSADRTLLSDEELDEAEILMWAHLFPKQPARQVRLLPRIAAAASVLLCLSIGGYFLLHKPARPQLARNHVHDASPGSNKAILTIANGKSIVLTGAVNGKLAVQGNVVVNNTAAGELVYHANSDQRPENTEPVHNTLTTPKGGKYDLTLADGTKVWLDAASSIAYPVAFTGKYRDVKITGQVYFEVRHNAVKPFRVDVNGQMVEVLGTHFNIMAYDDEKIIKTTLLQGSVKVTEQGLTQLLKPGQQAQAAPGRIKVIDDADVEEVIAWKNGYFKFNGDLESIMVKVARWYDVDVIYEFKPGSDLVFGGKISRSKNISAVLNIMELTGNVHFKIDGRRVTVMR